MPSKASSVNNISSILKPNRVNKYSAMTGFTIIIQIITIIIATFILDWLNKIKSCKCTNIPERKFLAEWYSFLVLWLIFGMIMYIVYNADPSTYPTFFLFLMFIVTIINIVMIIRLFLYIRKLREMNCDCGLSQEQNIIYYYIILVFAFVGFLLFMGILGLIFSLISN